MNGDNLKALDDCKTEIGNIRSWIDKNQLDSNIKYLVSYAVIKACGTIEFVLKDFICDFLSQNSIEETKFFLQRKIIKSSFNPSTQEIGKLFENLSSGWKSSFESRIKDSQEKQDLNSLISLRNSFAHGIAINVSIQVVERYFESGRKILSYIEDIILNNSMNND